MKKKCFFFVITRKAFFLLVRSERPPYGKVKGRKQIDKTGSSLFTIKIMEVHSVTYGSRTSILIKLYLYIEGTIALKLGQ